jgi:hypothetical protein
MLVKMKKKALHYLSNNSKFIHVMSATIGSAGKDVLLNHCLL